MTNLMKITRVLVQSKGKENICSSCNQVIEYDTIQQRWLHLVDRAKTCRKPSQPLIVYPKPINFRYRFTGELAIKGQKVGVAIYPTKVDPRQFNNRGKHNSVFPTIDGNSVIPKELDLFQDKIIEAGNYVIKNYSQEYRNMERWVSYYKSSNGSKQKNESPVSFSISQALDQSLAKHTVAQNLTFTTINSSNQSFDLFYDFLDATDIDKNATDIATLTNDIIYDFEEWLNMKPAIHHRSGSKTKKYCYRSIKHYVQDVNGTIVRGYSDYKLYDIDKSMLVKYKSKLPPLPAKIKKIDLNSGVRAHTRDEFDRLWNFDPSKVEGISEYHAFRALCSHKLWKFQILTSLAASDITNFDPHEHLEDADLIELIRHKKRIHRGVGEATPVIAEVYPETLRIIKWFAEVYRTHKYKIRGERSFFGLNPINENKRNYASCNLNMRYKNLIRHVGVPTLYTHMPRKTCATILHQGGVPLLDIKRQLGDSTDAVVEQTYIGNAKYDFKGVYKKYFLEETDEKTVMKTLDNVEITSELATALIKKLQESL